MKDLSILIPARNELYLQKTIDDIRDNSLLSSEELEILFAEDDGRGQRKTTNLLARRARGKYLMKVDAHCSFSRGFDKALLEQMDNKTILAPLLMPLDGPTWSINGKKKMAQFMFDTNFVMQHAEGEAGESMCLQGSAWMVSKENYWKWNLGDDSMPSWGGQGVELGIKAFMNGGRCMTTDRAYYGHVFRVNNKDFPYERGENPGQKATEELRRRYKNQTIAPLVEKFGYPADWTVDSVLALEK